MYRTDLGDGLTIGQAMPHEAGEMFQVVEAERPRLCPWFDWTDATRSIAGARAFIQGSLERFGRGEGTDATIRLDGAFIGNCGIFPASRAGKHEGWEIGYWLSGAHTGRGYATRVTAALVDLSFGALDGHRVMLRIATENHASRAVAQRLGFVHEGTLREVYAVSAGRQDLEVWGMLSREWPGAAAALSGAAP
ncbi:MAG: GNAT family N-acetyltransferase [Phycisphaerales bacterium]